MVSSQLDAWQLKKTAGEGAGYTDLQLENVSVLRLAEYLALPVQHCQGFAIVRTDPHREVAKPASNPGLEQGPKRLERLGSERRQKNRGRRVERPDPSTERLLLGVGQPIHLVKDQDLRAVLQIEVTENTLDDVLLLLPARVRCVDDVSQNVRLSGLFERRAEGRD